MNGLTGVGLRLIMVNIGTKKGLLTNNKQLTPNSF